MKYQIVKTENYLLIVDDSDIKEGDYCTTHLNVIDVGKIHNSYTIFNPKNKKHLEMLKDCKKIIAHLPLNNSPILEGVDLLPPLEQEDDVEKFADNFAVGFPISQKAECGEAYRTGLNDGFIAGYIKSKEKYKYTEEDVRKAIDMAQSQYWDIDNRGFFSNTEGDWSFKYNEDEIIQSLSQPKYPIIFEYIDTITTENGNYPEWVGKYIY